MGKVVQQAKLHRVEEDASFVVAAVAGVVVSDHLAVASMALVVGLAAEHPLVVVS